MRVGNVVRRAATAGCLALGVLALGARVDAQPQVTECGRILTDPGNYYLTGDLGPCTGHGVVVAASNVNLTLAGFTIRGVSGPGACNLDEPQSGVVLQPGTSQVLVSGGTIQGFVDGINVGGADSRVTAMTLADNCFFGMTVSGPDHNVDANVVTGSGTDGIALCEATNALVGSNHVRGSGRFAVIASCPANDNHIVNNVLEGNGLPVGDGGGVAIYNGERNRIADNAIRGNWDGIWLSYGPSTIVSGNVVNGNMSGGIGVSALSPSSQVTGNTAFTNNLFDLSDESLACGSTTWAANFFATDSVAGVSDNGPGFGCIP
jgi:parallel beta-helix repeat protein